MKASTRKWLGGALISASLVGAWLLFHFCPPLYADLADVVEWQWKWQQSWLAGVLMAMGLTGLLLVLWPQPKCKQPPQPPPESAMGASKRAGGLADPRRTTPMKASTCKWLGGAILVASLAGEAIILGTAPIKWSKEQSVNGEYYSFQVGEIEGGWARHRLGRSRGTTASPNVRAAAAPARARYARFRGTAGTSASAGSPDPPRRVHCHRKCAPPRRARRVKSIIALTRRSG